MEDRSIKLVITITASPWTTEEGSNKKVRVWNGPPSEEQNTAARVTAHGIWPFKRFEWCIWGPFSEELVLEGSETSEELAMKAADEALGELVLLAEATSAS